MHLHSIHDYFFRAGGIFHTVVETVTHGCGAIHNQVMSLFHKTHEQAASQPVHLISSDLRAKIFAHAGYSPAIRHVCRNWKKDYEVSLGRELINTAGPDLWNATMGFKIEARKVLSDDECRLALKAAIQKIRANWKWIMFQEDLTPELNTPEKIACSPHIFVKLLTAIDAARLFYFFRDQDEPTNLIESDPDRFSLISSKDSYLYDNTVHRSSLIGEIKESEDLLYSMISYSMEGDFFFETNAPPWEELPVFVVPKSIEKFQNLTELKICRCKVQLPESIGNLQNLHTLTLNENGLHSLPQSFSQLHLKNLSIYGNKDLALNEEACLTLVKLRDQGCDIECDPEVKAKKQHVKDMT